MPVLPIRPVLAAVAVFVALLAAGAQSPAHAQAASDAGGASGFASLRHRQVNMRTGPGRQHPVLWLYRKRELPMQVLQDYDRWRLVRDWEGTEGWVHDTMLQSRRTVLVTVPEATLVADPAILQPRPVAIVRQNVVGRLLECPAGIDYCRVEVEGFEGWLTRSAFWGVMPDEVVPAP